MLAGFLDLLFPPLCSTCDTVLVKGEKHICMTCGIDLFPSNKIIVEEELMRQRFANASLTQNIVCYSRYEKGNKTQKLIYKLK